MEPVRLEILLDDKTLKGMRSVESNLSGIGLYAKQVIAQLEQELLELQKQYRNAMAAGTNTDAQMADIQALQGVVRQLKTELQDLEAVKRKTNSTPVAGQQVTASMEDITKKRIICGCSSSRLRVSYPPLPWGRRCSFLLFPTIFRC